MPPSERSNVGGRRVAVPFMSLRSRSETPPTRLHECWALLLRRRRRQAFHNRIFDGLLGCFFSGQRSCVYIGEFDGRFRAEFLIKCEPLFIFCVYVVWSSHQNESAKRKNVSAVANLLVVEIERGPGFS